MRNKYGTERGESLLSKREYINALKLDIKVDMSVYEREFDNEA